MLHIAVGTWRSDVTGPMQVVSGRGARRRLHFQAPPAAALPAEMANFLAGANDFLVHVACADTDGLRRFVADHLNRNRAIAGTETSLIFEHARAAGRGH